MPSKFVEITDIEERKSLHALGLLWSNDWFWLDYEMNPQKQNRPDNALWRAWMRSAVSDPDEKMYVLVEE
jgi:hypothetical protein